MATEKDVEKAQERVAKLRRELADKQASNSNPAAEYDYQVDVLAREEETLKGAIAEIQATKDRQHPDAANPLAFAQAMLTRDEIVVDKQDEAVVNAAAAATTGKDK